MKILIIQQKRIGDVLTSSVLCDILKRHLPDATIDFMCYPNCTPVLENNPNIHEVIVLTHEVRKKYPALARFIKGIRNRRYDAVIDVYGKLETQLITAFSGAKYKIGYKKVHSFLFYNQPIVRVEKWTRSELGAAIENRLRLLSPLISGPLGDIRPKVYLTTAETEAARVQLASAGIDFSKPIVMIGIMGSEWYKTLPFEQMAPLLDYTVAKTGAQLLYNYIPSQAGEARNLYDLCNPQTRQHTFFDLYAGNLRGFLALLSHCRMLIGNEGGAVNMAKALDVPTYSIFSPSVDKETWQIFEDERNVSIHLKDIEPEWYEKHDEAYIKERTFEFFAKYPLESMKAKLDNFFRAAL